MTGLKTFRKWLDAENNKNRGSIEVIKKFYPLEHIYSAAQEI